MAHYISSFPQDQFTVLIHLFSFVESSVTTLQIFYLGNTINTCICCHLHSDRTWNCSTLMKTVFAKANGTAGALRDNLAFVCPSPPFGRVPPGRDPLSQGFIFKSSSPRVTIQWGLFSTGHPVLCWTVSVHSQQNERQGSKGPENWHQGMAGASREVTKWVSTADASLV